MVPLPCVRTPEKPPVTAMTNAIRLVLAPSPRNTGLQILIFEASRQHLSQESGRQTNSNSVSTEQYRAGKARHVFKVAENHFMRLKKMPKCARASNRTAQRVQMVPLPCVRTPEKPPVTAMTNAIRLVLAPSPRNPGLQILIFEASPQLSQTSTQMNKLIQWRKNTRP